MSLPSRRTIFVALLAWAAAGCARSTAGETGGATPPAPPAAAMALAQPGQLARYAAVKLMVLPAQAVTGDDRLGWRGTAGGERALLASLDTLIESTLAERGLASLWLFPPALARSARRNPTYLTDPSSMRALDAVRVALRKPNDPLAEPFASQLRALAGVSDARYALVPLELRLDPVVDSPGGRAHLRLAVVDARGSQVVWVGEVAGEAQATFGPSVLGSLATRVAGLAAPRQ